MEIEGRQRSRKKENGPYVKRKIARLKCEEIQGRVKDSSAINGLTKMVK